MDNKHPKHPRSKRRSFSIDGVSRPASTGSGGSIDFKRPTSYRPSAGSLDNFKKPEGFSGNSNKPIIEKAERPQRRSFEPPKEQRKRRRFFRRKRHDGLTRRERWKALSRKQKAFRIFAVLVIIVLLITGFLFAKGYLNLRKVLGGNGGAAALQKDVDPSKLKGEGDGRINILLMGRGGEGHEGADLTDTMILVSINPIDKEAALVSIPRDLYVKVPNQGSMKINAVFSTGKMSVLNKYSRVTGDVQKQADQAGYSLVESTVSNVLGVPVHYHAMVDFTGFKQAVDTVGGVDLNAPEAVREQMRIDGKNYLLDVKPGWQHMDGFKALAYSRSRHTSARGDFDRSERQRLLIVALKEKVFSLGTFSNPAKISQLSDNFGSHVQTNFSIQDLSRLYDLTKQINSNKFQSIGLVDPPHDYLTTSNVGGLSVVIPKAGVNNYKDIQSYIRNTLKDSFIKNENASIMVLNGTQVPGLATTKADELKSYGYNITNIANAPTRTYTNTVIVDLRNGNKKYTKRYLEQRFKVTSTGSLPDKSINPGTADFVIILGTDQGSSQ